MLNTFSVTGLIAWLETQDPTTGYNFLHCGDCLLHRYLSARGVPVSGVGGDYWRDKDRNKHPLSGDLRLVARRFPHNYGAALARAKATLDT